MAHEKPTIVILGGAWHTPEHYRKLRTRLEASGFQVEIPVHPSLNGARPPTAGLAEDTANARSAVETLVDAGRRVVVLAHSYGGTIATNSLSGLGFDSRKQSGLSGGVINIVYLCATAFREGGSMFKLVKEMGHEAIIPLAFVINEDMTVLCTDPKTQLIGDDAEPNEIQAYLDSLVIWNGQCMSDEITSCSFREIPVTYVHTEKDATILPEYQKAVVSVLEENGPAIKTYSLDTGHCPNLTATDDVVNILKEVAA